jgi:hypothetical protein
MGRKAKPKPVGPRLVTEELSAEATDSQYQNGAESSPSQEKTLAPGSELAEPDHSRVPMAPKKLLEPKEFFEYWRSIPKPERDAWFIAYAYRKMPICDPLQPLTPDQLRAIQKDRRKAPESNCGKFTEPLPPENWLQEVYQKWGAGDYQIRLNDQHPSVKATVCETHIRGLREWDKWPPILKVEEVVLEEYLNQPYLRWARLHGIRFPGDPGYQSEQAVEQENEDMAVQATVLEKMTDAFIENSRQVQQHQAPVVATDNSNSRAAEVVASAAMEGQKIITEALRISQGAQAKAADPAEHTKNVIEMARLITAQPAAASPSLAEMLTLMTTMMAPMIEANKAILEESRARAAAAEKRAELLETRLMAASAPPAAPTVAPEVANPVRNAIDLIKGLVSLKDQAGSLLGSDGSAGDADMPVWARLTSKAFDVLPGMIHNAAVLKTGAGQPLAPGELSSDVVEAEAPQQAAAALPEVKQEDEGVITKKRIAQEIAGPLINALNDGKRGFEFAAGMMSQPRIMGFPGRVVYEMAVEQGEQGMMEICQAEPSLWGQLVRIPNQFQRFLKEFLDRDAAHAVIAEAKAAASAAPPVARTNGTPEPEPVKMVTPTVMPKGRVIVNPADGKVVHTAPVVDLPPAS